MTLRMQLGTGGRRLLGMSRFGAWAALGSLIVLIGCLLVGPAHAVGDEPEKDVQDHPGYIDFGIAKIFGTEEANVEVFLEGNLISMVAAATRGADPELSDMLSKLKEIRVQTFKIDDRRLEQVEAKTAEVAKSLEKKGWQTVVRVREHGEQVYVYMKSIDNKVQGLVVMSVDPKDEAAFVNIVGEIDPEQIGRLGHKFHIDALGDSLKGQFKHKSGAAREKAEDETPRKPKDGDKDKDQE